MRVGSDRAGGKENFTSSVPPGKDPHLLSWAAGGDPELQGAEEVLEVAEFSWVHVKAQGKWLLVYWFSHFYSGNQCVLHKVVGWTPDPQASLHRAALSVLCQDIWKF